MLTDDDKQWIKEQLDEFHKWASPLEMRQRAHTAALHAIDAEIESLADRVTKLEGGTE